MVVVPLASHWENRSYLINSKEGSAHRAAETLKNCMGTPMAFESQVETPESTHAAPKSRICPQPLLARRNPGPIESFRRIKKALMPQSCVR